MRSDIPCGDSRRITGLHQLQMLGADSIAEQMGRHKRRALQLVVAAADWGYRSTSLNAVLTS